MARDEYVMPVDPTAATTTAAAVKKKTQPARSWILVDAFGQGTILDADKQAIMHRVQIHARDLRILDPLLSYPSTILGRERAIVLNLEHIEAIITSEEVLLRDPLDENVIPVVEELQSRLPPVDLIPHINVEAGEEDESPFEFRALEVALEAICSFLAARPTEVETAAYPALDELTSKISSRDLDRVRKLKSAMTRLTARVQKACINEVVICKNCYIKYLSFFLWSYMISILRNIYWTHFCLWEKVCVFLFMSKSSGRCFSFPSFGFVLDKDTHDSCMPRHSLF